MVRQLLQENATGPSHGRMTQSTT